MNRFYAFLLLAALCSLPLGAAQIYSVNIDTSSLPSVTYPGPFTLDFQFLDGGGTGSEPNNSATISQFDFGSGVQNIAPITFSDAFFVPQDLNVTLGLSLSFLVSLTANADVAAAPDALSFRILSAGNPINTTDPSGALVVFTEPLIDGGSVTVDTFDAPGVAPTFSPNVQAVTAAPTPEPATSVVAGAGFFCLALASRWLSKRRSF